MRRPAESVAIEVVHRCEDLLVVLKPSGLATTAPDDGDCLVKRVRLLDPDAPRLHPSSRLDAEVTGMVTFARTKRATLALTEARRRHVYRRLYLALTAVPPAPPSGEVALSIAIAEHDPRQRIIGPGKGDKDALTRYQVADRAGDSALLALFPQTGRTHQLRVHMTAIKTPMLGDVHYQGPRRVTLTNGRVITARRVMLHCAALDVQFDDALDIPRLSLIQEPPADFKEVWRKLGGAPGAVEEDAIRSLLAESSESRDG